MPLKLVTVAHHRNFYVRGRNVTGGRLKGSFLLFPQRISEKEFILKSYIFGIRNSE
nr:hypothetical protein [Acetobacter persici]